MSPCCALPQPLIEPGVVWVGHQEIFHHGKAVPACHRLPTAVVESQSLEGFKSVDVALGDMGEGDWQCWVYGWTLISEGFFSLNVSMIL